MKLATQTVVSSLVAFVVFVALVFLPAGTFDYWQGMAVHRRCSLSHRQAPPYIWA